MTRAIIFACLLALFAGQVFGAVDDAHTVSLLHFDGNLTDENGRTWTPGGGAAASSTQSKFGGGALHLDGDGDWIETPASSDFTFDGAFTVDFWIRLTSFIDYNAIFDTGNYASSNGLLLQIRNFNYNLSCFVNAQWKINAASPLTLNNWTHIAVQRDASNTLAVYVGGNLLQAASDTQTITSSLAFKIGREYAGRFTDMWVDEFRVSKGVARFSGTSFAPPVAAYSAPTPQVNSNSGIGFAQGGRLSQWSQIALPTYLGSLLHFDFPGASNIAYDATGRTWTGSNADVSSLAGYYKFSGGTAIVAGFKPTNMKTTYAAEIHPGSSDFCVDFWVMWGAARAQASNRHILFSQYQDGSNYWQLYHDRDAFGFDMVATSGFVVNEYVSDPISSSTGWHHYEFSRTASTSYYFVDGVLKSKSVGSALSGKTIINCGGADIYLWRDPTYAVNYTPWFVMDEFRFQKGGGGHTSSFSVPESPYSIQTYRPETGIISFASR